MENFKLGDRVKVNSKKAKGEIVFIGETHFSGGIWYGIVLDEPKGQNSGTVKGKRYFKCPKNHGIFAKACQLSKRFEDSDDGSDKSTNIHTKSKIIYPNYLKASSKRKQEKQLCPLNNNEIQQTISQDKNECSPTPDYDTSVENLNLELQSIRQENEDLKNRLKDSEKRLKESIEKQNIVMEDMKEINKDLDCKRKQISVQKCHLRMLKMRQCNHYKNVDSLIGAKSKKSEISTVAEDNQIFSDDEFDLESMKALTSMRRIVELEEQNRIMIEGLVELREFLKSQCQSHFMDIEIHPRSKVKNSESCPSNPSQPSSLLINNGVSPEESESQLKEYRNMLREMRKFSEIIKGKSKNEFDNHKSKMYPAGDFLHKRKDQFSVDGKTDKFKNGTFENSGSSLNKNSKIQDSYLNGGLQKPQLDNNALNLFQMFGDQNANKLFNLAPKVKDNICFDNVGDSMQSNISYERNKSHQLKKCDATVMEAQKQCGPHVLWNQYHALSNSSDFISNYEVNQPESIYEHQLPSDNNKLNSSNRSSINDNSQLASKAKI